MNTESILFREKAADYLVCYNDNCEKAAQCLRRKVAGYVPDTRRLLLSVNPGYVARKKGKCEYFQSAEPIYMGKGLVHFYDRIPESAARAIRKQLLAHFGNSNYYRYRSGERLIKPEIKEYITEVCRKHGWTEELVFDETVLEYQW
jgi:hypothetical protein